MRLDFSTTLAGRRLGWEFTSLLGELGARDTATWQAEALRMRHGRALEVIESVCSSGTQPDPGGRLAGILIIVRDTDAEPLTREEVGRRMAQQREAQAAAAATARRAEAQSGQGELDDVAARSRSATASASSSSVRPGRRAASRAAA